MLLMQRLFKLKNSSSRSRRFGTKKVAYFPHVEIFRPPICFAYATVQIPYNANFSHLRWNSTKNEVMNSYTEWPIFLARSNHMSHTSWMGMGFWTPFTSTVQISLRLFQVPARKSFKHNSPVVIALQNSTKDILQMKLKTRKLCKYIE